MTISFSKFRTPLRGFARAGAIHLLSAAMIFAPTTSAFADGQWGQAASAGAGNLASAAPMTGLGALSTMQGANSMAKGKQQMQCCKEGCDGAGKEASANKAAQDGAANSAAQQAPSSFKAPSGGSSPQPSSPQPSGSYKELGTPQINPTGYNYHQSRDSLALLCTHAPSQAKMIFDLFRPQKVEAMAGCNDAMMAMAQGAMQMLSGLAGLAAGMMGAGNGNKSNKVASNLGETPSAGPTSTAAENTTLTGTGNTSPVQIDPALLRDGKGAAIAAEFEKNFGIPAQSFANALLGGADPRAMLMNAPKNAFTAGELNQAFTAAKNMSPDQKAAAMAAAGLSDLQNAAAAKVADAFDAGAKSASRKPSSSGDLDPLDELGMGDKTAASLGDSANSGLSPELQAALAARDSAEARENSTIFQVVHAKYQERVRMIYGFDAHGHSIGGKGVADANGF